MAYFSNDTIGYNNTTTMPPSDEKLCFPFSKIIFTTVNNSVPYYVNGAINAFLAVPTSFTNLLVLLAMRHVTSIRLPSKLLLCNLALTDIGTGVVVQPMHALALLINDSDGRLTCIFEKLLHVAGSVFSGVSLFTMAAISLDRYAALLFRLRYQQLFTTARVGKIILFGWFCALSLALTWLWDAAIATIMSTVGALFCFAVISVAYIKIFRGLSRYQHNKLQVQPVDPNQSQEQGRTSFNVVKYSKMASTMLWVYLVFLISHTPFLGVYVTIVVFKHDIYIEVIREFAFTVLLISSCLNPFVYYLRLPEIRTNVLKELRKICLQQ